jgi:hypothetical protein
MPRNGKGGYLQARRQRDSLANPILDRTSPTGTAWDGSLNFFVPPHLKYTGGGHGRLHYLVQHSSAQEPLALTGYMHTKKKDCIYR